MKKIYILMVSALMFTACKKDQAVVTDPVIVEPPISTTISIDTIKTGTSLGFVIGEHATSVYTKLQAIQATQNLYLSVVANVFTNLDSLKTRIPLYGNLYIDEQVGTATGLQFTFESDKVKSIFNNSGVQMAAWPTYTRANATINVGDAITDLYQKLVNIQQIAGYAPKLQRMSLFGKNVAKAFDPIMTFSPQWYYNQSLGNNRYRLTQLNFKNGVLLSIYLTVVQY